MWTGVWRGEGLPLWLLRSGSRKLSYVTEWESELWLDITKSSSNTNIQKYTSPVNSQRKLAAPRYVCNHPHIVINFVNVCSYLGNWKYGGSFAINSVTCNPQWHFYTPVSLQIMQTVSVARQLTPCPASYCKFYQSPSVTHNSSFELIFAVSQLQLKHPLALLA